MELIIKTRNIKYLVETQDINNNNSFCYSGICSTNNSEETYNDRIKE